MDSEGLFAIQNALFIGAHPDDIEFYCGGLVHLMRRRGIEVVFAIATRGGRGRVGPAGERLKALRSRHAVDAAEVLGGARVILFDYPDKDLFSYISPLSEELQALIERESPDLIFSWDPDFIYNPHPDHQAAAEIGRAAAQGHTMVYYGTTEANIRVTLDDDALAAKFASLRAHRTETPWYYYYPIARRRVLQRLSREGRVMGVRYAEGYRAPEWMDPESSSG